MTFSSCEKGRPQKNVCILREAVHPILEHSVAPRSCAKAFMERIASAHTLSRRSTIFGQDHFDSFGGNSVWRIHAGSENKNEHGPSRGWRARRHQRRFNFRRGQRVIKSAGSFRLDPCCATARGRAPLSPRLGWVRQAEAEGCVHMLTATVRVFSAPVRMDVSLLGPPVSFYPFLVEGSPLSIGMILSICRD